MSDWSESARCIFLGIVVSNSETPLTTLHRLMSSAAMGGHQHRRRLLALLLYLYDRRGQGCDV